MRYFWVIIMVFYLVSLGIAQCNQAEYNRDQSPKIANYTMDIDIDHAAKTASGTMTLQWKNSSPNLISKIPFYMYMNAFNSTSTSYLRGSERSVLGKKITEWTDKEWGYITMDNIIDHAGNNLTAKAQYVQYDDGNIDDKTVLEIPLPLPILPGETATFHIEFTTKLPKTIVRSGYSRHDFHLFVHWFPQVGVYEQNKEGVWGWNCHQFLPRTEFFADFGDYDVTIHASDHLTIGATGCRTQMISKNKKQTLRFQANDVIDFGFVVYSDYESYTSQFMGVDIEILMPPEHCAFVPRYQKAIEHSIEYLNNNIGRYPYPKITIVDPPVHSLNSGFMEYPMMITGASFYGIPDEIRTVESLIVHEFTHMYFMATLASNEKEEAWLDEGFVTYYEDRITDHFHGEKTSIFDILGFTSGNGENSRLEYSRLDHSKLGPIAVPGWEVKGPYKGLIYAKTATVLKTFENLISRPIMDKIIKRYFEEFKFKHPKEADFRRVVNEQLSGIDRDFDINEFFEQCLHGTEICDFELAEIQNIKTANGYRSTVKAIQKGGLIFPVDIVLKFENGKMQNFFWDGRNGEKSIIIEENNSPIVSAQIDPQHKIYLDINFNNNSLVFDTNKRPIAKYAAKVGNWMQTILHLASFLL